VDEIEHRVEASGGRLALGEAQLVIARLLLDAGAEVDALANTYGEGRYRRR